MSGYRGISESAGLLIVAEESRRWGLVALKKVLLGVVIDFFLARQVISTSQQLFKSPIELINCAIRPRARCVSRGGDRIQDRPITHTSAQYKIHPVRSDGRLFVCYPLSHAPRFFFLELSCSRFLLRYPLHCGQHGSTLRKFRCEKPSLTYPF